jgi:hypothetical protein
MPDARDNEGEADKPGMETEANPDLNPNIEKRGVRKLS